MRTRVLLLNTDLETGGAPHFVRDLSCGLDKSLFDIQVVALAPVTELDEKLGAAPTCILNLRENRLPCLSGLINHQQAGIEFPSVGQVCIGFKAKHPDLIVGIHVLHSELGLDLDKFVLT